MTGAAHSETLQFRTPGIFDSRPSRRDDTLLLDGNAKRAIEIGRSRLLFGAAMFTLAYLVIAARLITVSLLSDGAEPRLTMLVPEGAEPERGEIRDRNGVVLATNLATASLYANPQQVIDIDEATSKISQALPDVDPIDLLEKLTSDRSFIWVKRGLTPRQQEAVNRLGLPGFYFQREERRVYPQGSLTAHVVGFADVDNHGLAGIEQSFDETLRQGGRPVTLSIDLRIQNILREELGKAIADFTAIGGAPCCWISAPARSWAWCRCRTSIPTRREPPATKRASTATRWASTRWAPPSRSSTRRWRWMPASSA